MTRRSGLQLIFHGAIFLLVGMFVGFPAFKFGPPTSMDDEFRLFMRQSHLIPLVTGIWLIAIAGALPHLTLTDRRARLLVWSLIVSSYSLLLAQSAWGVALKVGWTQAAHEPILKSPLAPLYIGALAVTALGALIGDVLIMLGAFSAIRQTAHVTRTIH